MKKLFFLGVLAIASLAAHADYSSLSFKTSDGTVHTISLNGLNIRFDTENMIVSNADTTLILPLNNLSTMEFADGSSVVVEQFVTDNQPFAVFTPAGLSKGTFQNLEQAAGALDAGIYIVKFSGGDSTKIVISK